jgi:hypothetical protein
MPESCEPCGSRSAFCLKTEPTNVPHIVEFVGFDVLVK